MTKVEIDISGNVITEDIVVTTARTTVPSTAQPPDIGLVEISVPGGDPLKVNKVGDTMSGDLAIIKASPKLILDSLGGTSLWGAVSQKVNGVTAWEMSTSNYDRGWSLDAYDVAGTYVASALWAHNTTKLVEVYDHPTATYGIATKGYVDDTIALIGAPAPASVPPLMDGVAAVGTTIKYAREDHRHPSDTAKLDAASYTAADVLTKIKTVDGTGSGLDADLLDGQSGAYYLDNVNSTGILPAASFNDTTHGNRAGGALHANVVAAGAAGFMTGADKTKLDGIATGAGVAVAPATVAPLIDGTAAVGTTTKYAREDHVHPTDTTRLAASAYTAADVLAKLLTVDGAGSLLDADLLDGNSSAFFAPIASPALTGNPTAPTPTAGDNDTSIATTAFVTTAVAAVGGVLPATVAPVMDGTATVGVATKYAREDHIHPSDTSRVAKAGDTMTGNLTFTGTAPVINFNATGTGSQVQPFNMKRDGLLRWFGYMQSGAASDFGIARADDAGAFIDSPFQIIRATGNVAIPVATTTTQTAGDSSVKLATTAFATTADALKVNKAGDAMTGDLTNTGKLAAGGAAINTNTRSALNLTGDITFSAGYALQWNSYYDSVAANFKAVMTGFGGQISTATADGTITIQRFPSVAAGAVQTAANVIILNATTGARFNDYLLAYGNSANGILHQNRSTLVDYYKVSGSNAFRWFKSSDGFGTGTGVTALMQIDDNGSFSVTGTAATTGNITSGNNVSALQNFIATSTVGVLAATGTGTIYLRPNGPANTSGQLQLGTGGSITVAGSVVVTSDTVSGGTANLVLATPTSVAGSVLLRPNGAGSLTGQVVVDSAGTLSVASGNIQSSTINLVLGTTGTTGAVYLRPQGVGSSVGQAFVNAVGDMQISGSNAYKTTAGSWLATSDIRLKNVLGDYTSGLAEILQVQPKTYVYKADTEADPVIGVIAQDIEAFLPECVTQKEGEVDGQSVNDLRIYDMTPLTYALINAVKELSGKLDQAMARIDVLEGV